MKMLTRSRSTSICKKINGFFLYLRYINFELFGSNFLIHICYKNWILTLVFPISLFLVLYKKDKQKLSYNNKWYLLKRKWCIYDALKILSTGLTKPRHMYLTFFACVCTSSSISREEAPRFLIQLGSAIIGAEGLVCLFVCPLICNRQTSDFKTSLIWTIHLNKQQPNVN